MKIAAGIAGILLGIFSLTYVGIFGTMVGAAAGFLGSIPFQGNNLGGWAEMTKMLSWLAPLATIVGGIVTFSNPLVGGILLGAAALLHWHLLGLGLIGKLFVLPIGATAALAIFAWSSTRSSSNLGEARFPAEPHSPSNAASGSGFDRAKWNALVQYDKDIALIAERLRPLGQKWLDEFASSYLALNDKQYLPSIEQTIVAAAKIEAEEHEQERIRLQEQRKRQVELWRTRTLARKKQLQLWRVRIWGNRTKKIWTVTTGIAVYIGPRFQDSSLSCALS